MNKTPCTVDVLLFEYEIEDLITKITEKIDSPEENEKEAIQYLANLTIRWGDSQRKNHTTSGAESVMWGKVAKTLGSQVIRLMKEMDRKYGDKALQAVDKLVHSATEAKKKKSLNKTKSGFADARTGIVGLYRGNWVGSV